MMSLPCPVLLMVVHLGLVSSYPYGPPVSACGDMFPAGHGVAAQTYSPIPYTLTADRTKFSAGVNITLTLRTTNDPTYPYFEGMFVQARSKDCNKSEPIGTFTIAADDDFLRLMTCAPGVNNAVSHKIEKKQTNKTFTWTAPSGSPGHIYFRATVVKNTATFWTNVNTPMIEDSGDQTPVSNYKACTPKTAAGTASSIVAATSLIVAAVVTSFAFF